MNTERTKICEKRIKLAELKLSKILHKIDTLKVDSYFISRLDTSGCKTNNCIRGANKKHIFVVILVALAFACRWIYSESLLTHFNFHFFANFYRSVKLGRRINECFYFSYKSGLMSLDDVFSMDEARANLSGDPWYVGWSTCYEEETRALRQYYARPYFLPPSAESDMLDWIFMGGPGQGAHMHVDSVRHMSWQAQIRGRKQWQLAPPPECLYSCRWISFTVEPGEILVVDTNRWYHQTSVLPGDMSITIGAEYD
ncbi:uncharacterized protein LOC112052638 isoform X2 [Bicyclus anynana]|uniref:Uncharacterized protein LOC112052638 isoform X2 n=1 Tax=Bicyclus anynana TaxID=110368 RepID=A0ABM3LP62_BICAN|nr:uncharacterized protein LOC112052638 isoform X2 [Bicyclus anynana]